MEKVRTALGGSFGTTVTTGAGAIEFDKEGVAEVTAEQADYLVSNFPTVYYRDGEEKPTPNSGTHIPAENDPAVKEFAKGHTAQKNAERSGAPAQVVTSTAKENEATGGKLLDASGNELKAEESTEESAEETKTEEPGNEESSSEESTTTEESTSEGAEELDAETVEMLEKLSVKDIHATLVSAGVQDDETAKIKKKDILIPIAAKKLT